MRVARLRDARRPSRERRGHMGPSESAWSAHRGHGKQEPFAGQALQAHSAALVEGDARSGDEVADRAGDEDLVRGCLSRDPGADVHGDAHELVPDALALAGVQAASDAEADALDL